jgi:hypothetical protein
LWSLSIAIGRRQVHEGSNGGTCVKKNDLWHVHRPLKLPAMQST